MPVNDCVIEKRNDAVPSARVHKFTHKVAVRSSAYRIEIRKALRIKKSKAVVMAGCEGYVLAACGFSSLYKLLCKIGGWIEFISKALIVVIGVLLLRPLSPAPNAVNSEVAEHTEAKLFKVLDVLFYNHFLSPLKIKSNQKSTFR